MEKIDIKPKLAVVTLKVFLRYNWRLLNVMIGFLESSLWKMTAQVIENMDEFIILIYIYITMFKWYYNTIIKYFVYERIDQIWKYYLTTIYGNLIITMDKQ